MEGYREGRDAQVLLGVTGSGKTFTTAHVIQELQVPALVLAPNKTLAAQLFSEFRELFPDNAPLRESLAGLADAIDSGGYLIYTCQPWHPQLEFIARALPNREGQPWIMRRRTQAEMDSLVRVAGFEKVEQPI